MKPLILISNDDGYHAKGMHSLINFIRDLGDIIVCAPESVRSGYSRAFSATTPLTITFAGGEYNELWTYAFTDNPPTGDGRAGYLTQFESPFTFVRVE